MNVEFGDDNRFKKRVTERLKANFAEDQGFAPSLGSTAKDSKSFDYVALKTRGRTKEYPTFWVHVRVC